LTGRLDRKTRTVLVLGMDTNPAQNPIPAEQVAKKPVHPWRKVRTHGFGITKNARRKVDHHAFNARRARSLNLNLPPIEQGE
jgi:hypothetical protein